MYEMTLRGRWTVVVPALRCCGSLAADDEAWEALLQASSDETGVDDAAKAIVEAAVPVEGDPDPRRAYYATRGMVAEFTTPGDVVVSVWAVDGSWDESSAEPHMAARINFDRNSHNLAAEMLAVAYLCGVVDVEVGRGPVVETWDVEEALGRVLLGLD